MDDHREAAKPRSETQTPTFSLPPSAYSVLGPWGKIFGSGAPPILKRLGLAGEGWLRGIALFGKLFRHAVGRSALLTRFAQARGRRWTPSVTAARLAFG